MLKKKKQNKSPKLLKMELELNGNICIVSTYKGKNPKNPIVEKDKIDGLTVLKILELAIKDGLTQMEQERNLKD